MKHESLHQLPASEYEAVARQIGKDYDAIIGLHRCSCGGTWAYIVDGEGFVSEQHAAERKE